MNRVARSLASGRGQGMVLALLALLSLVLAPPGFMVGRAASGAPPAIVICTGHGPMTLTAPAGKADHRPSKSAGGQVCAFAGHALASAAPLVHADLGAAFVHAAPAAAAVADLAPGRGLAAPPPPSQAPPVLL